MSLVIDASVILRLLLHTGESASSARTAVGGHDLHAPHLVDIEVTSGLRRFVAAKAMSPARAAAALTDLATLNLDRYPHVPLLPRMWQLRPNLSAYDASYAALAETLVCPLLTSDRGLATAPGPHCPRHHLS